MVLISATRFETDRLPECAVAKETDGAWSWNRLGPERVIVMAGRLLCELLVDVRAGSYALRKRRSQQGRNQMVQAGEMSRSKRMLRSTVFVITDSSW